MNEEKNFIAYEYISINVKSDLEPVYMDVYENFGWISTNSMNSNKEDYYINSYTNGEKLVNLKFKRNRKIDNKEMLNTLQRKIENSFKRIARLEKEPSSKATMKALMIAMIGTIFMTLSVFSITASKPLIIPTILFGIPGTIGWIIPYFSYKKLYELKTEENSRLIEEEYNNIYEISNEARKLLG